MKKKKIERPERPIEISKFVDKFVEKGGITTADGGSYLAPQMEGSQLIETSLRIMRPDDEPISKKKDRER